MAGREGWTCPNCRKGVSPDERTCPCVADAISTITLPLGVPDTMVAPSYPWRPTIGGGSTSAAADPNLECWN